MGNLVEAIASLRGKRVLLTGDTGFKGSWLALWLLEAGAEVYGYALPPLRPEDHFNLLGLRHRLHHCDGDIRDRPQLSQFFQEAQPEFVFHLAAQALVRASYQDPQTTFDTNIGGSVNLLECVRETASVRTLIYVTSDKCYRNQEWLWGYRENDPLGGRDPYSASKAAAEIVFAAYGDSFFATRPDFGYGAVRAGNVIGGGDWSSDRLVPDCFRSLSANQTLLLRHPQATRPWQHVLEPLSGYLTLAIALSEHPKQFSGAWNFGPQAEANRTVAALAQGIIEQWGSGAIAIAPQDSPWHEAGLLHLNCDKAHHQLGWRSRWDFNRTVAETVDWYRAFSTGAAVTHKSIEQIQRYLETVDD
ncbi:MAG: CDP-glucose 4,6-dehydratase [Spirulina sp. DLM2.Bin59]|nr:MAG: CDP-glucose 4,6-dehydratase [Spirulina sp. DLM2.Bin59]